MKRDYQKGFIYKLCCLDTNITEIYIGSSTNYQNRKQEHKKRCCNENYKEYNYKVYQFIRENGGWENWRMVILHDFPCNSKRELEKEETKMMRELKSELNDRYSFQTEEIKREAMDRENKQRREKFATDPEYREKLSKQKAEKIECEYCKCLIRKDGLKRHHQESKKCIKHQQQQGISVDENIGKVECEFCHSIVTRGCLKRHQTTAKYCIKIQNK